jgi:predicted AAA+ superfamily ATPase
VTLRNIPEEKVISRIQRENLWWSTGSIDAFHREMRPRAYLQRFSELVRDVQRTAVRRAPILMGPRRVGKTVLLFHLIQTVIDGGLDPKRICYVSVEHPVYHGLGLDDLVRLGCIASGATERDVGDRVFVFDEIQYLKDWEVHMKALVDGYPNTVWIASGSAAAALRLKSHESGAGRFTDFLLPPLTFHEYVTLLGREDLVGPRIGPDDWFSAVDLGGLNQLFVDYLNFGGYPEVALSPAIRADPGRYVRQDIIDKVLLRDLPSLYGIADIQELNSLFTALAYNTANEISLDTLSQRAGIAKNTIKRYLEYLEAAFLVKRVQRIGQDGRRFQRAHHFKVYLTNPSLCAALFSPIDADDPEMGAMVETAIFGQWFHGSHDDLHYARWKDGEVDLVHCSKDGEVIWACEAKWSDRFAESPRELDSLIGFCKTHSLSEALVTTRTQTRQVDIDGIQLACLPASLYCYTIGYTVVADESPIS